MYSGEPILLLLFCFYDVVQLRTYASLQGFGCKYGGFTLVHGDAIVCGKEHRKLVSASVQRRGKPKAKHI